MFNFVRDCKATPTICQMSEEKISSYIQINMVWYGILVPAENYFLVSQNNIHF